MEAIGRCLLDASSWFNANQISDGRLVFSASLPNDVSDVFFTVSGTSASPPV